jgi:hypothetical protein
MDVVGVKRKKNTDTTKNDKDKGNHIFNKLSAHPRPPDLLLDWE